MGLLNSYTVRLASVRFIPRTELAVLGSWAPAGDNSLVIISEATAPANMKSDGVHRELPPLILFPFSHHTGSDERQQPKRSQSVDERQLEAFYAEFRMLCLIGKDLNRWLSQCVEMTSGDPKCPATSERDFIGSLLFATPRPVQEKLRSWGVASFQIIFSRALGLNSVFPHPPESADVPEPFLRNFCNYADALFDARMKDENASPFQEDRFTFEIYASGEYSSLLEKTWEG